MADIINVDTKEISKKIVLVEKHTLALLLVVFGIVIFYLFIAFIKAQNEHISYITTTGQKNVEVITENTAAKREEINVLIEIKNVMKETQIIMQDQHHK